IPCWRDRMETAATTSIAWIVCAYLVSRATVMRGDMFSGPPACTAERSSSIKLRTKFRYCLHARKFKRFEPLGYAREIPNLTIRVKYFCRHPALIRLLNLLPWGEGGRRWRPDEGSVRTVQTTPALSAPPHP